MCSRLEGRRLLAGKAAQCLLRASAGAAVLTIVATAWAQPIAERGPEEYYYDNERYDAYAPVDDDQFIDSDDFYYDEYYEAYTDRYEPY